MRRRSPPPCAAVVRCESHVCACASSMPKRGCSTPNRPAASACWGWRASCSASARRRSVPMSPDAHLLAPELGERLVDRALRRGGDFADVYVEQRDSFSLSLDDHRVERAQAGSEAGAAIRVVAGDATYFGHVDGLAEHDLERLAGAVAAAGPGGCPPPPGAGGPG